MNDNNLIPEEWKMNFIQILSDLKQTDKDTIEEGGFAFFDNILAKSSTI